MAFAAALPLLTAAAPSLISTFGGGKGGGGGGGGLPMSTDQTSRQDVSVLVDNVNNVVGGNVSLNFGGQQQLDGSLAGGRYLDRGVDTPVVDAPFGTMQDVEAIRTEGGFPFSDLFGGSPKPQSNMFLIGGIVLVVVGAGFALLKKKR